MLSGLWYGGQKVVHMSSISSAMHTGASALNTYAWGMTIVAHNVANVNTDAFEPQRIHYADGPGGEGVRLNAVSQGDRLENVLSVQGQERAQALSASLPFEIGEPGGTDLPLEMTHMISTQRSYEANAVSIRTADEMLGTVLDLKA